MMMRHRQAMVMFVVFLALGILLPTLVVACPTCKDGLAGTDPDHATLVRGYFWSILFMMSMPFLIFASLSGYFYYEVRRARSRQAITTG